MYENVLSNAARVSLLAKGFDTKLDKTDTAPAALRLAIARTISLSGDVTGSVAFDGSGNVSLAATVADDSHNHVMGNIDGLQAALNAKQDALGFTPVQQGGGTGQNASKLYLGWGGDGLLLHVDNTNFANNWPISITKNAATASKLATARAINGVAFDGSANINIPTADGSKLPLAGGGLSGKLTIGVNVGAATTYSASQLELNSGGTNPVALGFHRPGYTACALVHAGSGLSLQDSSWGTRAPLDMGTLTVHGNAYITGDASGFYSDERLKENIEPLKDALSGVRQLQGVRYSPNALAGSFGFDTSRHEVGLLAQDVKKVLPEAVTLAPFDRDEEGLSKSGEEYLTLKYERVVPLLVEAIKTVDDKVEVSLSLVNELVDTIASLKARVSELENK